MQIAACKSVQTSVPSFQWEIYDTLPPTGNLPVLGYAGPLTGINNERLLIAGGANFPEGMPWLGGKKKYHNEGFILNPEAHKDFERFSLPLALAYSANVSTSQGIACIGGENENGPLNKVFLVQYRNGQRFYIDLPPLPFALTNTAACAIAEYLYVAGGETVAATSASFFKMDLKNLSKGWQQLSDIPYAVSHTVLQASESRGKIYLIGGRCKTKSGISELHNRTWEYDIGLNKWHEKKPLPYALSAGTSALVNNDYIVLFGGDRGMTFRRTEELIQAINLETDSVQKEALNQQKVQLQKAHPGFSNEILLYDLKDDAWLRGGTIPFPVPVTTTAVVRGKTIWIPSGEIKAGIRSPYILKVTIQ